MRISVRKDDRGYDPRAGHGPYVKVYVNGADVTNRCYTADEEKGKAWCFRHNADGQPFPDPKDHEQAACEVLAGAVKIVIGTARVG